MDNEQIEAYIEYYQKIMGGDISNQPSRMVVAAIISLSEADKKKEKLQWIIDSRNPVMNS